MSDLGGRAGGHAKVGKAENKRGTKRTASARLDDEPKGNAPAKPGPMSFATRGGGTVSLDNDNDEIPVLSYMVPGPEGEGAGDQPTLSGRTTAAAVSANTTLGPPSQQKVAKLARSDTPSMKVDPQAARGAPAAPAWTGPAPPGYPFGSAMMAAATGLSRSPSGVVDMAAAAAAAAAAFGHPMPTSDQLVAALQAQLSQAAQFGLSPVQVEQLQAQLQAAGVFGKPAPPTPDLPVSAPVSAPINAPASRPAPVSSPDPPQGGDHQRGQQGQLSDARHGDLGTSLDGSESEEMVDSFAAPPASHEDSDEAGESSIGTVEVTLVPDDFRRSHRRWSPAAIISNVCEVQSAARPVPQVIHGTEAEVRARRNRRMGVPFGAFLQQALADSGGRGFTLDALAKRAIKSSARILGPDGQRSVMDSPRWRSTLRGQLAASPLVQRSLADPHMWVRSALPTTPISYEPEPEAEYYSADEDGLPYKPRVRLSKEEKLRRRLQRKEDRKRGIKRPRGRPKTAKSSKAKASSGARKTAKGKMGAKSARGGGKKGKTGPKKRRGLNSSQLKQAQADIKDKSFTTSRFSVVSRIRLKDVINYETFSRLAPAQKAKLLALLPAGDQTPEGLRHLLTNSDAFVQALAEYQTRLVAGDFDPDLRETHSMMVFKRARRERNELIAIEERRDQLMALHRQGIFNAPPMETTILGRSRNTRRKPTADGSDYAATAVAAAAAAGQGSGGTPVMPAAAVASQPGHSAAATPNATGRDGTLGQ